MSTDEQGSEPDTHEDDQREGERTDRPAHVRVEDDGDGTSAAPASTKPPPLPE